MIKKLLLTTTLMLTTLIANTVTDKVKDLTKENTPHIHKKNKHSLDKTIKKEKRKLKQKKLKMEAKAVSKIL